jgi:hypothetical protein
MTHDSLQPPSMREAPECLNEPAWRPAPVCIKRLPCSARHATGRKAGRHSCWSLLAEGAWGSCVHSAASSLRGFCRADC